MTSNPYETSRSSQIGPSDDVSHREKVTARDVTNRFKTIVIALGVWQLVCLAMAYVYRDVIGHVVVWAYTELYGDIQASYVRYARLATYIAMLVITLTASVVTIAIVDRLSARKATAKRKMLTLGCWQFVTMLVLASSHEFGFPYMVNQLGWKLFGPPAEIYSFQNLLLHRIIAWLLCTVPIASFATWIYTRSPTPSATLENSQ